MLVCVRDKFTSLSCCYTRCQVPKGVDGVLARSGGSGPLLHEPVQAAGGQLRPSARVGSREHALGRHAGFGQASKLCAERAEGE